MNELIKGIEEHMIKYLDNFQMGKLNQILDKTFEGLSEKQDNFINEDDRNYCNIT